MYIPSKLDVTPSELWLLLLCTVRYSMGRSTYIVDDACMMVLRFKAHVTDRHLKQIRDEVSEELTRCEAGGTLLGMELDHRRWRRFIEEVDAELTNGDRY